MVRIASSPHPPRASTTRGVNLIPMERHSSASIFLSSPTLRAYINQGFRLPLQWSAVALGRLPSHLAQQACHVPNWEGRRQLGDCWNLGSTLEPPSVALEQQTVLQRKVHHGWSRVCGSYLRSPHSQHGDLRRYQLSNGKQDRGTLIHHSQPQPVHQAKTEIPVLNVEAKSARADSI